MSVLPWIPRRAAEAPSAKDVNVQTEVPPADEIPDVVPPNKFQRIIPLLLIVAVVGMIGIFFAMGLRRISPFMLMFPLMMLMGVGGMMAGFGNSGGPKIGEINLKRRKYLEMLTGLRRAVHKRANAQYRLLAHYSPEPRSLAALVGGPRMWERSAPDRDPTYFLAPRVGLAAQKLGGGMTMNDAARKEDLEPVARTAAERFLRAHRSVEGMPAMIDLKTHRSVQFFGEGDLRGVIRAMLLQLAVFHPPNLVLIAVITDEPQQWDWIKWLPHAQHPVRQDALGAERMVYSAEQAGEALAELLSGRGDFSADTKYTGAHPWLIIVADGPDVGPAAGEGSAAVTVLRRGGADETGLEILGARVQVSASGESRLRRMSPDDPLKAWVRAVDTVDAPAASRVARVMARWRAATDQRLLAEQETQLTLTPKTWASLHHVADVGAMGTSTWREYREGDRDRMRVPIGWDRSGAEVSLNIKEPAEQGMGSHGLILGTTGSGKSTLLINLLLGLVARHTPEQLNLIIVDYKGESTFDGFEQLHHTVEIISNLSSLDMITRFEAVMRGEIEKRQLARSELGKATVGKKFRDANTYLRARERGADLPPFPSLLVVVDEFTALLKDHPGFKDVFEHLGRQGRSDRVCLLLATQSLTGVNLGQLLSNAGWTIAMKTATSMESQTAIGSKDAYYLDAPGPGLLKVGGGDPQWFNSANPQDAYFAPLGTPAQLKQRRAFGEVGVADFSVTAVPVADELDDEAAEAAVAAMPEPTAEETANAPEVASVVLEQLAGQGPQCRKMWLPPLLAPRPVGELIETSGAEPGRKAVLKLPIGLIDRPYLHTQDVFCVDLTDNHLLMVGRPRSGKSVAMQTLAIAAARCNTPRAVQIYGLDCGADLKLLALEGLPHVSGVAPLGDFDAISRVIAEVTEVMDRRTALFRELRIGSMAAYRELVATGKADDDGYGDVLLLIDGFDAFKKDYLDSVDSLITLTNKGLAVGIHVVLSLQVHSDLGRGLSQSFNRRIDFKLNQPELSGANNKKLAEAVPAEVPGRALAVEDSAHIMIGAPRLDDVAAVDDAGLAEAIERVTEQWAGQAARSVRMLPERVEAATLVIPEQWTGSAWSVPIGLYEKDLSTVMLDLLADRHLNIFGRRCGKTHLLAAIMRSLMARHTPDEVKFILVDLKSSELLDVVDERYILKWNGITEVTNPDPPAGGPYKVRKEVPRSGLILSATEVGPAMEDVARSMAARSAGEQVSLAQRRERSWWDGPEIVILVDDYTMVHNAAPQAFAPLAPYWGNAQELGVHAVVACPIAMAMRVAGMSGSLMKLNNDVNAATLVMDGLKENGPILGVRVKPLAPGRGVLVTQRGQEVIQTPVVADIEDNRR